MISELQQAQLDAFDETLALLPAGTGNVTLNGKTVRVIPAPVRNSRILQEAGYNTQGLTSIDLKRADFVALGLALDSAAVTLDGTAVRVVDINNDPTDAIVNVALKTRN